MIFQKSQWIWLASGETPDQYAEFFDKISGSDNKTILRLSCDSDYALFINERFVASNQYGDFEHYKIYDTLDVTEYLTEDMNTVRFLVYHCGLSTQRYRPASAGLIYEIERDGEIISSSDTSTLSGLSAAYSQNRQKWITSQLGLSFFYDMTQECKTVLTPSVAVDKQCTFFPRPIKKHVVCERQPMKDITFISDTDVIIDLGEECVGLPCLDISSKTEQTVTISYGERLEDGHVPRIIGGRDFSFGLRLKKGDNRFTEDMLRIGCRYLEVVSDAPIEINYLGLLPQSYPLKVKPVKLERDLDGQIYDMCIKTLRLCMMEHYVDCPWREQALYACDSRNQMLIGYYAFEGGNLDYARANLKLMSEDRRDDGHLSICFPCGEKLSIPSFSLYYIIALDEYISHSGDTSLGIESYDKILGICREFENNMKDGLVLKFSGDLMWNFYDWTPYSEGTLFSSEAPSADLALNSLYLIALRAFRRISTVCEKPFPYSDEFMDSLARRVKEVFMTEDGIFTMTAGKEEYTVLSNVLAILAGTTDRDESIRICDRIAEGELIDCSLSMKLMEYKALLMTDTDRYKDFILSEIRKNYSYMLSRGADTAWETIKGYRDFDNAGSLCHGWSAVPVYIYHKLGMIK